MIPQSSYLGLPLEKALSLAEAEGFTPVIRRTDDPRSPRVDGTARVVRVRGDEWTVSLFHDGEPQQKLATEG